MYLCITRGHFLMRWFSLSSSPHITLKIPSCYLSPWNQCGMNQTLLKPQMSRYGRKMYIKARQRWILFGHRCVFTSATYVIQNTHTASTICQLRKRLISTSHVGTERFGLKHSTTVMSHCQQLQHFYWSGFLAYFSDGLYIQAFSFISIEKNKTLQPI